jgi:heme-degrading monooxygenase HmoA
MPELLTMPPPAEAIARMAAVEGVNITPAVLSTQRGPDGHLGPEAAGAVLILQATFTDEERAAAFWQAAASLMEALAHAPGFIRRFSFADGPTNTLIALWRTTDDANAFFASTEHQAAMRDLYRHRWQYSHFASLFETTALRERVIFCQDCDGITPMPAETCRGCGAPLVDAYAPVRSS